MAAACNTRFSKYNGRPVSSEFYEFDKDQFAKMIISKCVEIVEHAVDERRPASEYSTMIKQYFGMDNTTKFD
jgi:hypothetical protein